MITEWILIIWMTNSYPMRGVGNTSPTILYKFNKISECHEAGKNWETTDLTSRKYDCVKVSSTIENKDK